MTSENWFSRGDAYVKIYEGKEKQIMAKSKQKNRIQVHHVVGWYGAIAIVSGYFLTSFDVIQSDQIAYQLINLSGASGLFYLGYKKRVSESMFLNAFWIIIASTALIKILIA